MHDELHMEIGDLEEQIAELEKENAVMKILLEGHWECWNWDHCEINKGLKELTRQALNK